MNPDTTEMARKCIRTARICLTNDSTYCSVCLRQKGIITSCAKCGNTSHNSNPTLRSPVSRLHRIISSCKILVLPQLRSPLDQTVSEGCDSFLDIAGECNPC